MPRHRYFVGILPWTLELEDGILTVRALWGATRVALSDVSKVGIACSRYDVAALGKPSPGRKTSPPLRRDGEPIALPPGPLGLLLQYTSPKGGKKDVAFTFAATDPPALAIVQQVLDATPSAEFVGVGSTPAIRSSMGLGGGDFVAGLVMFAAIGGIVALLMWLDVLS